MRCVNITRHVLVALRDADWRTWQEISCNDNSLFVPLLYSWCRTLAMACPEGERIFTDPDTRGEAWQPHAVALVAAAGSGDIRPFTTKLASMVRELDERMFDIGTRHTAVALYGLLDSIGPSALDAWDMRNSMVEAHRRYTDYSSEYRAWHIDCAALIATAATNEKHHAARLLLDNVVALDPSTLDALLKMWSAMLAKVSTDRKLRDADYWKSGATRMPPEQRHLMAWRLAVIVGARPHWNTTPPPG